MHEREHRVELRDGRIALGGRQLRRGTPRLGEEERCLLDFRGQHHPTVLDAERIFLSREQRRAREESNDYGGFGSRSGWNGGGLGRGSARGEQEREE